MVFLFVDFGKKRRLLPGKNTSRAVSAESDFPICKLRGKQIEIAEKCAVRQLPLVIVCIWPASVHKYNSFAAFLLRLT
ncbi:MAG TPA: hypothetical protein DEF06_10195 [Clostridiales bacterium]|nr:hypothetical protein [Clostridiales bacterium]